MPALSSLTLSAVGPKTRRPRLPRLYVAAAIGAVDLALSGSSALFAMAALDGGRSLAGSDALAVLLLSTLTCAILFAAGLYGFDEMRRPWRQIGALVLLWSLGVLVSLPFQPTWTWGARGLPPLSAASGAGLAAACLLRVAAAPLIRAWRQAGALTRPAVVLGLGEPTRRWIEAQRADPAPREIDIIGVFAPAWRHDAVAALGLAWLGTADAAIAWLRANRVDMVILGGADATAEERAVLGEVARTLAVDVAVIPQNLDPIVPGLPDKLPNALLVLAHRPLSDEGALLKRFEDMAIAGAALLVLGPLMALAALAIKLDSPGPVLFRQPRFGLNNQVIEVLKFRTMHVAGCDRSGAARTVRGDPRVTRLGRILRRSSIDELPQLFNVLAGEMSIVGPRAHAVAMRVGDALFGEAVRDYPARHRVRPGITGLAQVNGYRGEVDTLEKAIRRTELDLHYVENWSIWLDLRILLRTIRAVVTGSGAY